MMHVFSALRSWVARLLTVAVLTGWAGQVASAMPPLPNYIDQPNLLATCAGKRELKFLYRSDTRTYAHEWCQGQRYIASFVPQTGALQWRVSIPLLPDEPGFGRNAYELDGAGEHGIVFYDAINGQPAVLTADGQFKSLSHFPARERFNEPTGVSIFDGQQFIWSVLDKEIAKYDIVTGKKIKIGQLPSELFEQSAPYALALYEGKLLVIRQLSSRFFLGNHNFVVIDTTTGAVLKKKKFSSTAPQAMYYFKTGRNGHFIAVYLNSGRWLVEPI